MAMIRPKGHEIKQWEGLEYIALKRKPDWLQSRKQWSEFGWRPIEGAKATNYTWTEGRSKRRYKLYHWQHCRPLGSKAALQRRINTGWTIKEAEAKTAGAVVQLRMFI